MYLPCFCFLSLFLFFLFSYFGPLSLLNPAAASQEKNKQTQKQHQPEKELLFAKENMLA